VIVCNVKYNQYYHRCHEFEGVETTIIRYTYKRLKLHKGRDQNLSFLQILTPEHNPFRLELLEEDPVFCLDLLMIDARVPNQLFVCVPASSV